MKETLFLLQHEALSATLHLKHIENPHSVRKNTTEQQKKNNKTKNEETKDPIQNLGIDYACLHMSYKRSSLMERVR